MTNGMILALFVLSLVLFFWGVHKAVKTQKVIYAWALFPFLALIVGMFLL